MAIKDFAAGRKDLFMVDPTLIREKPGWNLRSDSPDLQAHIRMLANSIKELGVQQPLTIFMDGDTPVLTDGHCRLAACLLALSEGAEIKSVPVRVEDRYASEADRVLSMITRNSGRPLTPLEMAEVAKRLLALGWQIEDVAKKAGLGKSYLVSLLDFRANAPEEIKKEVIDGNISQALASELVRKEGPAAIEVVREAQENKGEKKITKRDIEGKKTCRCAEMRKLLMGIVAAEGDSALVKAIEKAEAFLAEN